MEQLLNGVYVVCLASAIVVFCRNGLTSTVILLVLVGLLVDGLSNVMSHIEHPWPEDDFAKESR